MKKTLLALSLISLLTVELVACGSNPGSPVASRTPQATTVQQNNTPTPAPFSGLPQFRNMSGMGK